MKDDKKPKGPMPMNRQARRSQKAERLKVIKGGKPADAPSVDMSQPAGRFAYYLHGFVTRYYAKNPDLDRTAACAAALQVAAKLGVELGGNAEEFAHAAEHFFVGEVNARRKPDPPPLPGAAG